MTDRTTEGTARPTERHNQATETPRRTPSWHARWTARTRAARLDAALAVGAPPVAGTALAVRAARLTSRAERDALAHTLSRALRDAHDSAAWVTLRVPLHRTNIADAEPAIDDVIARLSGPHPVAARGVARLTRMLADGHGPFYRFGRGDLSGRLRAALAAM
jgi:hypothetical protein